MTECVIMCCKLLCSNTVAFNSGQTIYNQQDAEVQLHAVFVENKGRSSLCYSQVCPQSYTHCYECMRQWRVGCVHLGLAVFGS